MFDLPWNANWKYFLSDQYRNTNIYQMTDLRYIKNHPVKVIQFLDGGGIPNYEVKFLVIC